MFCSAFLKRLLVFNLLFSLLDQTFVKNQDITIDELIKQSIALLGENIQIARFQRFTLGLK